MQTNKQRGEPRKKMKSRRERKKEGGRKKGREERKREGEKGERERRYLSIVSLTIYSQLVNHQSPDLHKSKPCISTCNKLKKHYLEAV